jgi:predicted membrane chloride channel (bestrophin family)
MTFNPRDLTINIRATSRPNEVYNRGPEGSIFPGWFISVYQNEGYDRFVDAQISIDQLVVITTKIDEQVDGWSVEHGMRASNWRVTNAAKACNRAMKDELRRQLKAAEDASARIPVLKKMLGEE